MSSLALHIRPLSRSVIWIVAMFVGSSILLGVGARQTQPTTRQKLVELNPDSLDMYLRLGESLLAQSSTDQDAQLALQTLAVGVGLANRRGDFTLAASMCIALASYEPDWAMRVSLWDLALMLDPDRYWAWQRFRDAQDHASQTEQAEAARAIYAARFNDPAQAQELLGQRAIRDQITRAAKQSNLDPDEIIQMLEALIRAAEHDPCRGRVFAIERGNGEVRRVVCAEHRRPLGSAMSFEDLIKLIKVETKLLTMSSGQVNIDAQTPWVVNELLDMDQPARDPSIAQVIAWYGVDLTKPYRRANRWASSP